jgi:hypothetical protein
MDNYSGGKLIATGSKTCIINPNIRCKDNKHKKRNKKTISKIAFGDKADEYSNREKHINDIIKRIPNHKNWALIYDYMCKPPSYSESLKIDKDISKCLKEESTYTLHSGVKSKKNELFDKNSVMLIGEFGGITLGDYFNKKFSDITSIKILEKEFLILMKKMKNIFKGLVELNNYEISHLDIKQNNIVLSKGNFKFIDFGLSNKFSNIEHFKNRANNEFKTSRIYLWYPPEYIFAYKNRDQLNHEIDKIDIYGFDDYRNHVTTLDEIYHHFQLINLEEYLLDLFNYYKKNNDNKAFLNEYKEIIKGIDCYSFGLLIPILFYNNNLINFIEHSQIISDYFIIFSLMSNPNHKKRIRVNVAYEMFEKLLNKHSKTNSKTKKTNKKKKPKTKNNKKKKNNKSKTNKN